MYVERLTRRLPGLANCLWLLLEMEQRWYMVKDSRAFFINGFGLQPDGNPVPQKPQLIANQWKQQP
jgi:hypothetical protein